MVTSEVAIPTVTERVVHTDEIAIAGMTHGQHSPSTSSVWTDLHEAVVHQDHPLADVRAIQDHDLDPHIAGGKKDADRHHQHTTVTHMTEHRVNVSVVTLERTMTDQNMMPGGHRSESGPQTNTTNRMAE